MKKLLAPDHRHPEATVFTLGRDKHLTLSSGPESSEPWQVLTPGQSPLAAQPQGVPVDSARTGAHITHVQRLPWKMGGKGAPLKEEPVCAGGG